MSAKPVLKVAFVGYAVRGAPGDGRVHCRHARCGAADLGWEEHSTDFDVEIARDDIDVVDISARNNPPVQCRYGPPPPRTRGSQALAAGNRIPTLPTHNGAPR